MLHGEHFAILLTFVKVPFVIKVFVLSILSGHFTQVLLYNILTEPRGQEQSFKALDHDWRSSSATSCYQEYGFPKIL